MSKIIDKNTWEMVKFEDCFLDITSKAKKIPKEQYLSNGKYPIIDQGQNKIAGYSDDNTDLYCDVPVIIFGDHTRILKYVDYSLFIGADGVKLLKSKQGYCKYLYYALLNVKIINTGYNRHFKWLKESTIPLPPLETQKQIADELDKITTLIEKRKTQIEKLDLLVKSKFIEMFGDPVTNPNNFSVACFENCIEYMGDIGSNGANAFISKNLNMSDQEDYAIMVRFLNFTANNFADNLKYVSKETYEIFSKSKLFGGELIFCKIGSAGLNSIMPILNRPVSLGLNQIMTKVNSKVLVKYLYYYLNTNYGKILINSCVNGAVTKSITKTALKKIPIVLSPLDLQTQFVNYVETTEQTKAKMQKGLEQLEILYKQRMQKYFE